MKKTVAFITGGLSFNGNTLRKTALGGSESALIYMARELAHLGNTVTVYCHCDIPGIYDHVDYRTIEQFMQDDQSQFDVLVVSRHTDFLALPLDSKLNILWCHDIDVGNFRDAIGVADRVFCLSDYHRSLYADNYNVEPLNYIWKTSNGYDQSIKSVIKPYSEKRNHYIYSSRPERGLKLLLEKIWPEIVEQNPQATLHLCGYEHNLGMPDEVKKIHEDVEGLLEYSRNVVKHGNLPKAEYYQLLGSCAYMLYPTDFPEISCINAIEAQYNGCLVITSDQYALRETVKSETRVKSPYGTAEYVTEFIGLLEQFTGAAYEAAIADAKNKIEKFSWQQVAANWNCEIDSMFTARYEKHKDKIIDQLVYNSDLVAAWKLTGDTRYRQMLDKAENDNLTISKFSTHHSDEDTFLSGRGMQLVDLVREITETEPGRQLKILDLGSNNGVLSLPLLKRFSKNISSMTLYDSSKAALDFVKETFGKKYPQLNYVVDSVSNVAQYEFSPDIVIVGELLEHIEDTQGFLKLLMSLATTNTLFYFTVPGGPWESIIKNNPDINHVHHFERRDIETIFKAVNPQIRRTSNGVRGRRGEPAFNWMFWFSTSRGDNVEFGTVDYQEKWLKTRPYKKISCCMIVKDEEDNISRCLKSVYNFVDEIVIVDTGSTDLTLPIAQRFTDKIYNLEWAESDGLGNFSRARNYSIDQATGDYIFWIDADEQLENWQYLHKYLTSDYYDGIMLKQRQCMSKQSHDSGINVDVMHDRIFKKGQIRFTGVVHEYPSKDGEHFLGKMFWQDQAWILHYGLANMELLKRKSLSRNSDLIYKNVKTYPDRIFAKHYILVDYWSKFISDHPTPNLSWLERAMNMWHTELKNCGDNWTIRLSLGVVQHFYTYCAVNGIAYKGVLPNKVAFKNTEGEVVEFYVLDPEEETDFFLKYISTYRR